MTIFLTASADEEKVIVCDPKQKSQGYRRSLTLRSGMQLLIQEYQLQDHLVLSNSRLPLQDNIEFVFNLIGQRAEQWERSGQSCICFCPHSHTQPENFIQEWNSQQWVKKIDIHIETSILRDYFREQIEQLPSDLRNSLENPDFDFSPYVDTVPPSMQLILESIFNCPYQGITERLYLESRVLELLALQIDRLMQKPRRSSSSVVIKVEDIERLHYAKEILYQRMNHPPSLFQLARLVELNEHKLKLGFHHVFGTTPFAYLRDRRLEKARQLLSEGNMKIEAIAHTVGYANRSRFACAFRKKYGVNPSQYKSFNELG